MSYKRFEIKDKWAVLLLMAIGLAIIFIVLTPSGNKRELVSLESAVSEKEAFEKPVVEFKPDKKAEDIKIQSTYPQEEKDISTSSSVDILEKAFAVQVFSFQDKNRAKAASEKLKKEGYPAYVITQDLGEKGVWHRVWLGEFKVEKEAIELLEKLKKDYKDSFIISR